MAQPQIPSMPIQDGQNNAHQAHQLMSDLDVPIDLSIAAAKSPTYPNHQQQYSPYNPHRDMQHCPWDLAKPMYASRPEWAGQHPQYPQHQIPYGYLSTSGPPASAMVSPVQRPPRGGHPFLTFEFWDAKKQRKKRSRRRDKEIERMYECGWKGCKKAYGTLNHLNAHVTMHSHGAKRTPEWSRGIQKAWKAKKKKEEEAQRKADEERQRASDQNRGHENDPEAPDHGQMRQAVGVPRQAPGYRQLPPIGYQPAASGNSSGPQYSTQSPGLAEGIAHYATPTSDAYSSPVSNNHSYAQSPYGQNPRMYPKGH